MNKKYYIKLMSANFFEENKSNKNDYKENPLVQMINTPEEDNTTNNQSGEGLFENSTTQGNNKS